jgi:hypothetical protein
VNEAIRSADEAGDDDRGVVRIFQQPATNGPDPGAGNRLDRRRRLFMVNAATASSNLIAASFFVIVPPTDKRSRQPNGQRSPVAAHDGTSRRLVQRVLDRVPRLGFNPRLEAVREEKHRSVKTLDHFKPT